MSPIPVEEEMVQKDTPLTKPTSGVAEEARTKSGMRDALEDALSCLRHTHDRLIEHPEFETLRLTINSECRKIRSVLSDKSQVTK